MLRQRVRSLGFKSSDLYQPLHKSEWTLSILVAVFGLLFYLVGTVNIPSTTQLIAWTLCGGCQIAGLALVRFSPFISLLLSFLSLIASSVVAIPMPGYLVVLVPIIYCGAAFSSRAFKNLTLIFAVSAVIAVAIQFSVYESVSLSPEEAASNSPVPRWLITVIAGSLLFGFIYISTWLLGALVGAGRRAKELETQQTIALAEMRRLEHQTAVAAERAQIAREMHDILAHSLAAIVAQAEGARFAAAAKPELAQQALAEIADASRSSLRDIRALLERLRHQQGDGPGASLTDISDLVRSAKNAGFEVDLRITGEAGGLSALQQSAIYRIAQESITNAIKYADRAKPILIVVDWHTSQLRLSVSNRVAPGRQGSQKQAETGSGFGLIGMRERAAAIGGQIYSGADPQLGDRMWRVTVTVPLDRDA